MNWLRALLFYLGLIIPTVVIGTLALLIRPLPFQLRYKIITRWTHFAMWWLRVSCGLRYRITGLENIPPQAAIIVCKHQSAWETMALQLFFPPQVWVLKRELLWLPFLGWAFACLEPIALNRAAISQALRQLISEGQNRLACGIWIALFPEGTRVPVGQRGRYNTGGAMLAIDTGVPLVPVAHNAGVFWPRLSFGKHPGVIDVVIGQPIPPSGKNARDLMQAAQEWIENTVATLPQTPGDTR